ncbi:MAG: paraquat-inducible protein A [Pseudomonadota bacterium]
MLRILTLLNLALLVVFPLSWFAPLMRAGLLPLFGLDEISILSGIASLWEDDAALAILVALLALVAPIAKTFALAAVHLRQLSTRALPMIGILGKLAMADIFLVAVYVALAKGLAVGRLETAWGLWLFTAAVLVSYAIAILTPRALSDQNTTS